jgi:hypothetical protein
VALVGAVAVFAAGVAVGANGSGAGGARPGGGEPGDPVTLPAGLELAGALTSFPGCDAFLDHVQEHALEQVTPYGLGGGPFGFAERADLFSAVDDVAAGEESAADGAAAPTSGAVPDDVSGTNVQEQGVDEPDRVKTDGEVLYAVTGDRIRVVDIAGDQPEQLAEVRLHEGGWGSELLLAGDRLLVTSAHGGIVPFAGERIAADSWLPGGGATTTLTVVDVSDPTAPEVSERLVLDGSRLSARMVDGVARVVIRTEPGTNLPWEHPDAGGLRAEREALAANEAVIRASTAEDWLPYYVHETADGDRSEGTLVPCERVAEPEAFAGLGLLSVLTVDLDTGALLPDRGGVAVLAGGRHRLRLPRAALRRHAALAGAPLAGWWGRLVDRRTERRRRRRAAASPTRTTSDEPDVTTELHAFAIDDPRTTEYLGSGSVDGTLLSQWALSEHDGVLRVAATIGDPWSASSSSSSVTTLGLEDGELVELGRVDGLGPTETIHAVRFLGEVGYVVTFRQVDPLYTVDLSDPTAPEVVGELKIPGYSAYLHPVGEGRLLGVGQDADEETGMTEGVQVSLFDVSDPADPRRTDTVTVPRGSSSVEWDHRAFLHWPATGLTVVPVTRHVWGEDGEEPITGPRAGALALVPEGDRLVAAADHAPEDLVLHHADGDGSGGHAGAIERALVVGDRLVTLSERGVIVHDLATLADRGALGF